MKYSLLILFCCSLTVIIKAQNFVHTPDQHRIDTVVYENFEAYDIYFTTPNPEAITFKWSLISNTLPAAWSYSLCDQGACYVGIPSSATMSPISLTQSQNGMQGFLKINLTTGYNYGNGKVIFYVYDAADINRGDTISFDIRWPAPNAIEELSDDKLNFSVYPNPSSDYFIVQNLNTETIQFSLTNLIGEQLYSSSLNGQSSFNYDASDLPKGVYFITYGEEDKNFTRKIVLN